MKLVFRMAELRDSAHIHRIENETFRNPWSLASIKMEIEKSPASGYVVCSDLSESNEQDNKGKVIGYCGIRKIFDEGYITNVAVDKGYRGRGISKEIMKFAEKWAKSNNVAFLTLEVRLSNEIAIELYKKCGFLNMGIRENYYDDGESVVMMRKDCN